MGLTPINPCRGPSETCFWLLLNPNNYLKSFCSYNPPPLSPLNPQPWVLLPVLRPFKETPPTTRYYIPNTHYQGSQGFYNRVLGGGGPGVLRPFQESATLKPQTRSPKP